MAAQGQGPNHLRGGAHLPNSCRAEGEGAQSSLSSYIFRKHIHQHGSGLLWDLGRQGLLPVRLPKPLCRSWEAIENVITEGERMKWIRAKTARKRQAKVRICISRVTAQKCSHTAWTGVDSTETHPPCSLAPSEHSARAGRAWARAERAWLPPHPWFTAALLGSKN